MLQLSWIEKERKKQFKTQSSPPAIRNFSLFQSPSPLLLFHSPPPTISFQYFFQLSLLFHTPSIRELRVHAWGFLLIYPRTFAIFFKNLENYVIKGTKLAWFRSYLTHRKQIQFSSDNKSDLRNTKCGLPHGSILGPLLLLVMSMIFHFYPRY